MTTNPSKQWHIANWSPLGWLETGIKLAAHVAAIIALLSALSGGTAASPGGGRLIQVIMLGLLALGLTLGIIDRYMEREIIAMGFILVNNAAHWGMVYALLTMPGPGSLLIIFAALMLIGDLVKLRWLSISQFSVRGNSPKVMMSLTGVFAGGYVVILAISLLGGS